MLHVAQVLHEFDEVAWVDVTKLFFAQDVSVGIVGAILAIGHQASEALLLVAFSVGTSLENLVNKAVIGFGVDSGILEQVVNESYCFRHILVKTAYGDEGVVVIYRCREVTSELVKFLLELLWGKGLGSKIVE